MSRLLVKKTRRSVKYNILTHGGFCIMAIIGLDLGASKLSARILCGKECFEGKINLPKLNNFLKEVKIVYT